jgi:hypothetical protein
MLEISTVALALWVLFVVQGGTDAKSLNDRVYGTNAFTGMPNGFKADEAGQTTYGLWSGDIRDCFEAARIKGDGEQKVSDGIN